MMAGTDSPFPTGARGRTVNRRKLPKAVTAAGAATVAFLMANIGRIWISFTKPRKPDSFASSACAARNSPTLIDVSHSDPRTTLDANWLRRHE